MTIGPSSWQSRLVSAAEGLGGRTARDPRFRNLAGLMAGFLISRGALFLNQTWLILSGKVAFLADFGIAYLLVSLASQIVDWGGQMLLARDVLIQNWDDARQSFWSLSLVRALLAAIFCAVVVVVQLGEIHIVTPMLRAYLVYASIGVVVSAINATGPLDGLGYSGYNGLISSLPTLFSALAIPYAAGEDGARAGTALGAAYSLGSILSVALQHILLALRNRPLRLRAPASFAQVWGSAADGYHVVLATLPGQFFYRVQVLGAAAIGAGVAGSFLYAKQIVSGFTQLAWFCRRTELSRFADAIRTPRPRMFSIAARALNVRVSFAAAVFVSIAGAAGAFLLPARLHLAMLLLTALSVTIATGPISETLVQLYTFVGRQAVAAYATCAAMLIGSAAVFVFSRFIGAYGLVAAEVLAHTILALIFLRAQALSPRTSTEAGRP